MQAKKSQQSKNFIKKIGILNFICICLFVGVLAGAATFTAYMYRDLPTSDWGERKMELPWYGHDLVIDNIITGWEDVSSQQWLAMSGISHAPYAKIQLGECTGNGTIYVQFHDSTGAMIGQPVTFLYENGQVEETDRNYYFAEGKNIFIYGYPAFKGNPLINNREQFRKYNLEESQALWRVEVYYSPIIPEQPNLREKFLLGYTTIEKGLVDNNEE